MEERRRAREATVDDVPFQEWAAFYADRYYAKRPARWNQGEHIALIGKTNCGKTTVARALLPIRDYVTVLGTKPRSESLDRFAREDHYRIFREWPEKTPAEGSPKRLLWPIMRNLGDTANQRRQIGMAMNSIFTEYGWTLYSDELRYITETLGLSKAVEIFLMQGRELGISFVGAMQRPRFVPLTMYSQSTHLFFWRESDQRNLEVISAINSIDSYFVSSVITQLEDHEFLYIHSPTGYMVRSKAPNPNEGR